MSDDDPEQRIRDLERPLTDSAAGTEIGSVGDRQSAGMRLGWVLLGLLTLALVIGGGAMLAQSTSDRSKPVTGRPTTAEIAGGGGTFSVAPPLPPPRDISVAGVHKDEKYRCDGTAVSVSGVDNKVTLTGHCTRVDVSGVGNTVVIEESGTIVVSGMNNVVTYRTGSPAMTTSGMNNTLERG